MTEISCHSIVIPAYNESQRLDPTLDRVLAFVRQHGQNAEIVVVNDGSTDQTADIVRNHAEQSGGIIRLLENPENRGKGYSVRNGVLNSDEDIVLFTDADLSAPIEEAPKLLAALHRGADIAIGSRWARSELQTQRQSLARQVLGRVFNGLLQVLLGLEFKDTQCGFKAFRREAARALFPFRGLRVGDLILKFSSWLRNQASRLQRFRSCGGTTRELALSHCRTVRDCLSRCSAFAGTRSRVNTVTIAPHRFLLPWPRSRTLSPRSKDASPDASARRGLEQALFHQD